MDPSEEANGASIRSGKYCSHCRSYSVRCTSKQTWRSVCRSTLSHLLVPVIQVALRCLYGELSIILIAVLLLTHFVFARDRILAPRIATVGMLNSS